MFTSMRWRIYAGFVATILITAVIIGTLVSRQVTDNSMNEIRQSLVIRSELLAEIARLSLNQSDLDELQHTIVLLGKETESRLTILDVDGVVLADSRELPEKMDNHSQRPEIIQAREQNGAMTSRFSLTLQQQMIYRALRVEEDGKVIGYVRVSLPLTLIDQQLAQLRLIVLFGATLAVLASLVLGFYLARKMTDRLSKMTEVASAISQGDYGRRITVTQHDEIGVLGEAFNVMARTLADRMNEITADRNRLAKIFSGMVEGVIAIDAQHRVIHVNQAAATLLNISIDECIDQPIWEQVRVPEINDAIAQAIDAPSGVSLTRLHRPTASNDLVIDIHTATLRSEGGEPAGAVLVLHDVSELSRLERVRQDFVANASHELKTPITAIRGLTETMIDDDDMPEETRRSFIKRIDAQSMRLSSLVTDLMTLSRLETKHDEQHFQLVDLGEVVRRSVTSCAASAQDKDINVNLSEASHPLMIMADGQAIAQLADNLLDNAVKYTPAGGSIDVTLSQEDSSARFTVKDNGIGIAPQDQQRVFERFYRIDKARSRELGGTGLGLSIVKNIVEQHSGQVSLSSQRGEGAEFTVILPLADPGRQYRG